MNRITELFGIAHPIIAGGMVWCSGWRLASAVSNHGGLGLIGAGSMHPDNLIHHIRSCREATDKPFGVNVPLLYPQIDELMRILVQEKEKIVCLGIQDSVPERTRNNGLSCSIEQSFCQKMRRSGRGCGRGGRIRGGRT